MTALVRVAAGALTPRTLLQAAHVRRKGTTLPDARTWAVPRPLRAHTATDGPLADGFESFESWFWRHARPEAG